MKIGFGRVKAWISQHRGARNTAKREFVDPNRDWSIGLITASVCTLAGFAYIAFDFHQQSEALYDNVTVEVEVVRYNERDVLYYAELYAQKEKMFETLRKERHASIVPWGEEEGTPLAEEVVAQ